MVTHKIFATFAFAACLAIMAPAAHAQARHGGSPVGHAAPAPGSAHSGGPRTGPGPSHAVSGPSHPVYGRPGYGYAYGPYYPYYRYPYYPYYGGFGFSFGFGFGYPYSYPYYPYYSYGYPSYYPSPYAGPGGYPEVPTYGGLRLDLPQKDAQVYADGYLAGPVSDFDGSTEHLLLTGGSHQIEIRREGFAPLTVDVNIAPGRTIVYRADLRQPPSPPPQ